MRLTKKATSALVAVLASLSALAIGADLPALGLSLVNATDHAACKELVQTLRNDKACRTNDALDCDGIPPDSIRIGQVILPVIEEIATNQYDYTAVGRPLAPPESTRAVVYVSRWEGDRGARLQETWKVDRSALNNVLALPPGPIPDTAAFKPDPRPPQDMHAEAFAAVLAKGDEL